MRIWFGTQEILVPVGCGCGIYRLSPCIHICPERSKRGRCQTPHTERPTCPTATDPQNFHSLSLWECVEEVLRIKLTCNHFSPVQT